MLRRPERVAKSILARFGASKTRSSQILCQPLVRTAFLNLPRNRPTRIRATRRLPISAPRKPLRLCVIPFFPYPCHRCHPSNPWLKKIAEWNRHRNRSGQHHGNLTTDVTDDTDKTERARGRDWNEVRAGAARKDSPESKRRKWLSTDFADLRRFIDLARILICANLRNLWMIPSYSYASEATNEITSTRTPRGSVRQPGPTLSKLK